jgi:hypothetical protein
MLKGEEVGKAFLVPLTPKTDPNSKYVVFVNANKVDIESFCRQNQALPPGTIVYPVAIQYGDTMDDVIRIYEVQ